MGQAKQRDYEGCGGCETAQPVCLGLSRWVVKDQEIIPLKTSTLVNTLVLHRNDFVDLIGIPGAYFGYKNRRVILPYLISTARSSGSCTSIHYAALLPLPEKVPFKKSTGRGGQKGNPGLYCEQGIVFLILSWILPAPVHDGHVCATDPFWQEFLGVKYREFFREFPQVAGIITSPATGESRVSIKSNRVYLSAGVSPPPGGLYRMVLTSMYEPIRQAGRNMIVRDFVFDSASQKELSAVMEELPRM